LVGYTRRHLTRDAAQRADDALAPVGVDFHTLDEAPDHRCAFLQTLWRIVVISFLELLLRVREEQVDLSPAVTRCQRAGPLALRFS